MTCNLKKLKFKSSIKLKIIQTFKINSKNLYFNNLKTLKKRINVMNLLYKCER